jgi:hypothetical protein
MNNYWMTNNAMHLTSVNKSTEQAATGFVFDFHVTSTFQ